MGAVALVVLAGAALAYWQGKGQGVGLVSAGSLKAPTNVSVSTTLGQSKTSISWKGSNLSGGASATGYYVRRIQTDVTPEVSSYACGSSPSSLIKGTGTLHC